MSDVEGIYDAYVDKVYKYFYINCLNRHVAEDLTSQTFVAFVEKAGSRTIKDYKTYLYAIMRNTWAEHLRKKYKEAVDALESIEDFEAYSEQTISAYEDADIKGRAARFIEMLPESQRQIARMRLLEEKSLKEIAQELNKSMSYVKTTQNRAIKSLKRILKQPETGGLSV